MNARDGWMEGGLDATMEPPAPVAGPAAAGPTALAVLRHRIALEAQCAEREGAQVGLLLVDLDGFREAQATLGLEQAELLLAQAAQRMQDALPLALVPLHIGGERFACLLRGRDAAVRVDRMAHRILHCLAQPFELDRAMVTLSASAGIAVHADGPSGCESLLRHAEHALRQARRCGGHRCHFFTPELQQAVHAREQLAGALRLALVREEFELHFQPIVDLRTGRIRKAEALLRWRHPQRGYVSPAEFIPLAEELHLIGEIGEWVFRQAVCWTGRWRSLAECPKIGINMSPAQFVRCREGAQRHIAHLREQGVPGDALVLEITEGLLLQASPEVDQALRAYRAAGLQIAIDDFGTGHASIAYLRNFPVDYLKIDRSFVGNLRPGADDLALCRGIVAMAHALGQRTVAEGVETTGQRDLLQAIGCDLAQGYLFSRALPPQAFEALLQRTSLAGHVPVTCPAGAAAGH